jgi:hypothetical protein
MLLNNLKSTGVIGSFYERHAHRLSVPVRCVERRVWISNCTVGVQSVDGPVLGRSQSPQSECEAQRAQSMLSRGVGDTRAMNKLELEIALWGQNFEILAGLLCPTPRLLFGPDAACISGALCCTLTGYGVMVWISNHARNTDPEMN